MYILLYVLYNLFLFISSTFFSLKLNQFLKKDKKFHSRKMVVKIVIYLKKMYSKQNTKMSAPGFQSRNMHKKSYWFQEKKIQYILTYLLIFIKLFSLKLKILLHSFWPDFKLALKKSQMKSKMIKKMRNNISLILVILLRGIIDTFM